MNLRQNMKNKEKRKKHKASKDTPKEKSLMTFSGENPCCHCSYKDKANREKM